MAQGKILIIDDDPDITEAMTVVLENRGYEVRSARDGSEGMEQLKQAKPDLIILDVMMRTSQEGFELSRELKSNAKYKEIPILMLRMCCPRACQIGPLPTSQLEHSLMCVSGLRELLP